MSKHLHAGRAAEAGVVAAELAALGFTGPPAILEGPTGFFAGACPDADPAAVLRDPDAPWQVHRTSIKPWPSCRHTHPAIDAALALAGMAAPETIETVEVTTYGAAIDVCDRPVAGSEYEAKFSLQHCVAAALQRGRIDFAAFGGEARAQAAPLAVRVKVNRGGPYDAAYPAAWGAGVAVGLADGRRLEASRPQCRGDPEAALSAEEMVAKARGLLRHGGINDPERVVEGILGLGAAATVPDFSGYFAKVA